MNMETHYEQLVTDFETKRRELLSLLSSVVPKPTEMHRRKWRIKNLENSIVDIKTTIGACNLQLDEERASLEQLNAEYDRLLGQSRKLTEDVKILEGVTGIPAVMPCDAETDVMKDIIGLSEHFRAAFAEFYFDLPLVKQELPIDPTLDRDSKILIASLRDFITLQFDHRATDAALSKQIDDKNAEAQALKIKIKADQTRIERDLAAQRQRIEQSAARMKESIQDQGRLLLSQGRKLAVDLQAAQDELRGKVAELEGKQRRLKLRCENLASQNKALRGNFKRRAGEIELELDILEHRLDVIKQNPCAVDQRLVNISLILSRKSVLINDAVADMRRQITDFNQWIVR
jgi:chromosome segregation ATPase